MTSTFLAGERPRPEWLRAHPKAWIAATATICFGAFMGQLDASVVTLTYRPIGHSFQAGLATVQWVSLSYLVTLAALLVPLGRLSDRLGRKRVYLWGFAGFTLASAGCALAPGLLVLVLLRGVQGAGAAMLQANSIALVATSAPPRRLRAALGIQASAQAIGLALGPTVGGLIVQTIGWRWVFAVNVPVGVVAMLAGRYLLPRTRIRAGGEHDTIGGVLRLRGVSRGLIGALLAYLVLFGPIVLVPAVLQDAGVTPLVAGLVVAALPVGFAVGAASADRVLPRSWTSRARGGVGILLCLLGLAVLVGSGAHVSATVCALTAAGLGLGVYVPANNAQLMRAVPARAAATTGGLVSTARALGTAGGTALVAGTLTLGHDRLAAATLLAVACVLLAVSRRPA